MARQIRTPDEIRAEVQRRVDKRMAESGDDDEIRVPAPTPLADVDTSGCNWTIGSYTGDHGYFKLVGLAVLEVKAIWNLESQE